MNYENQIIDNITRYRLLTKPGGLTYKDICALIDCGKSTAHKTINSIHEKTAATPGTVLPISGRVTRQSFCDHMNWDFDEIQAFAFAEISAMRISNDTYYSST